MASADTTEFTLATLKATSAVTNLVMDGAAGIFETGELDADHLAGIEEERRQAGNPSKILAILIRDAGEKAKNEMQHTQRVEIYLYDRECGYANIRLARKQVYLALKDKSTALDDPLTGRGTMDALSFEDRTGHLTDRWSNLDYEKVTFEALVSLDLG